MTTPINFQEKFKKFSDHWSPRVIAEMNDYQFKIVRIKGDFVWHQHDDTDEAFIVIDGKMSIEFDDHTIELKSGEMIVVSKGEKHRPYAELECKVLLVEPRGVVNTGDAGGRLTAPDDIWL